MYIGLYSATSGMLSNQRALNVTGNNIANAQTSGFKKDLLLISSFGDNTAVKVDGNPVGTMSYGAIANSVATDFTQGFLNPTGRSLDIGIQGNGFFTIKRNDGTTALTRSGQFEIDGNGYLVTSKGEFVQGENGNIKVDNSDFTVNEDGEIYMGGNFIDKLKITCPSDTAALTKISDGLYSFNAQGTVQFNGTIKQQTLETSNIDMTDEMTDMIKSSRAFQSCSQMVKMLDETLKKSVNELGRL